jgi:hypothetical protein
MLEDDRHMTERPGHHSRVGLLMLSLAILAPARSARAISLIELLPAVAIQARAPSTLRADVRIEREGSPAVDAVLVACGRRVYLETRAGTRALLSPGKTVIARRGHVVRAPVGMALAGSDVLLEDLEPFGVRSMPVAQVSDENPLGIVVTGAPAPPSAYALLVHTIDPERDVILQTKYYRDSISNLVKIRKDEDLTQIGGRWRPGTIGVESLRPPGTTHLVLNWREAPDLPPALLTPAGLLAPSPISWPQG